MKESNYEEYKRNLSRDQNKRYELFWGKASIVIGIVLLLYVLCTLPFRADNVSDMSGDELKDGKAYYFENLQILHARVDDTNEEVYCVAKFLDQNQNDWILSFNPRTDEHLVKRIKLSMDLGKEFDIVTSGYVYLDDVPGNASVYYSSHGDKYADSDGENVLELNADYLCGASGNYTLQALLRPSYTKKAFVWGIIGILFGGYMLFKNRTRKSI